MIAVIDNYDSFTYNLVQFLGELVLRRQVRGAYTDRDICVWRNDELDVEELVEMQPSHVVISPGPGTPAKDAGISNDVIRLLGQTTPTLGVCLGQQCIGHVFGGQIVQAPRLMHGKVSPVEHDGSGIFTDLPSPFLGYPLSQPYCRGATARRSESDCTYGRRRANGPASCDPAYFRRPVSSGEYSNRVRKRIAGQLPAP